MKSKFLATSLAFAIMAEAQPITMNTSHASGSRFTGKDSPRLTPLTPKQKRRRKLNKIGRKTRKLNFKH